MKYLVCLLVALALFACEGAPITIKGQADALPNTVRRYVDTKAGVVCWVFKYSEAGGIDCMPISETRLGQ